MVSEPAEFLAQLAEVVDLSVEGQCEVGDGIAHRLARSLRIDDCQPPMPQKHMAPGPGAKKGACTPVVRTAMRDRLQHRGEGVRREHVLRLRNPSGNSTHVLFPAVFRDRVALSAWMRFGAFPNRTCKIRRSTSSSRSFQKLPRGRTGFTMDATAEPVTDVHFLQLFDQAAA